MAAIAVMTTTLTIVLFSVITNATFANTIEQLTDKIDVSVFLKDEVTDEQREKLISELKLKKMCSLWNTHRSKMLWKNTRSKTKITWICYWQSRRRTTRCLASLRIKPVNPNELVILVIPCSVPIVALQSIETSYSGDRKEAIDKITSTTDF